MHVRSTISQSRIDRGPGSCRLAVKIGTVSGIPLYLDYSWFIIFALIAYTVGFWMMPASYPNLSWVYYLSIGILSAILLFVSIIIHELAHSIVAKRNGLKIGKITLYLLGGVSEMEEEPPNANLELKMSAAGPLTSIAISVASLFGWIASVDLSAPVLIQGPLFYLFLVNALVSGFNLIPAFPMDGGRILRSLIWRRSDDMMKSTRIASTVGRVFAYIIMFVGIFFLFTVDVFDGIWLLLIGWFISSAASSEMNQMIIQRDLADLKASDIMTRTIDFVAPEMTLTELSSSFLQHKHNGFPVMENDKEIVGCITMDDLRHVKRNLWDITFVRDVMTPKLKLVTVKQSDSAQQVAILMTRNRVGRIFVVDESEQLCGIITRSDLMKTIQIQEGVMGGTKGRDVTSGRERLFSVEKGMMFEIDCPPGSWSASFSSGEFTLVSENIVQLSSGGQTTQFAFEPLKKGTLSIMLYPKPPGKTPLGPIKYSVIVT